MTHQLPLVVNSKLSVTLIHILTQLKPHQWVDALVGQIVISGGVALDDFAILGVVALSDLVDLKTGKKLITILV